MKSCLKKIDKKDWLALALLFVAFVFLLLSLPFNSGSVDTGGEARKIGRQLSRRMIKLEAYMKETLSEQDESWLELTPLPEDMVIYKYVDDTLRAWGNQFSLKNDDISHRMVYPMFSNPKAQYESPLTAVTAEPSLICMGPKWYLVQSLVQDDMEIIGGLKIVDEYDASLPNKVNRVIIAVVMVVLFIILRELLAFAIYLVFGKTKVTIVREKHPLEKGDE